MARTYGHPDPTRSSQPSQHRNTLKVQDALRAISNGDVSGKSHISKDDFLDFICSFPRLYRVGGVIGERLTQWLSENKALAQSWEPQIEQLRPGFFRSREEDVMDDILLDAPGVYVRREERGLPESYAEETSSSKKPKARTVNNSREEPPRASRSSHPSRAPLRSRVSRVASGTLPGFVELDEEPYGTPLDAVITDKFPAFVGLSVEQFALRTAEAAQADMGKIRRWFRAQRQVLDPTDPLADKFKKLEAELPKYEQFVGVAEMIVQVARAQESDRKRKKEEEQAGLVQNLPSAIEDLARVHFTAQADSPRSYEMEEDDDEGVIYDGIYNGEAPTPSKAPAIHREVTKHAATSRANGLVHRAEYTTSESAGLMDESDAMTSMQRSHAGPRTALASDSSDLSPVPNLRSLGSSQRASASFESLSPMAEDDRGGQWTLEELAQMDDPSDENYQPLQSGKRKRKRTQKAIESSDVVYDSDK